MVLDGVEDEGDEVGLAAGSGAEGVEAAGHGAGLATGAEGGQALALVDLEGRVDGEDGR